MSTTNPVQTFVDKVYKAIETKTVTARLLTEGSVLYAQAKKANDTFTAEYLSAILKMVTNNL